MARSTHPSDDEEDLYSATPPPASRRRQPSEQASTLSRSPTLSASSDKENRSSQLSMANKGKGRVDAGAHLPTPGSAQARGGKRRRVGDRNSSEYRPQSTEDDEEDQPLDLEYYDPDQDIQQRRHVRKGLR